MMISKLYVLICLLALVFGENYECPPKGFDTVKNINLTRYTSSPWYVQQQVPVVYQPIESLYCVRAIYEIIDPQDLKKGINVFNYANMNMINGEVTSTKITNDTNLDYELIALVPDPSDPGKLKVGPKSLFLASGYDAAIKVFGDYWIVALGPETDDDSYEWAIISVGPPKTTTKYGCRTGDERPLEEQGENLGFWLFAHDPLDPIATAVMRKVARHLSYDLTILEEVKQKGCLYRLN